ETQRRAWIRLQLGALGTRVVREEHESTLVDAFQEHDARRRNAVAAGGRQRHRVRLEQLAPYGVVEPPLELHDGVSVDVVDVERRLGVVASQVGERHAADDGLASPLDGRAATTSTNRTSESTLYGFVTSSSYLVSPRRRSSCEVSVS